MAGYRVTIETPTTITVWGYVDKGDAIAHFNVMKKWENKMNRKQLQEWLDQFPEDTVISVVVEVSNPKVYGGSSIGLEVFNGGDNHHHYADFSLYDELHKSRYLCEEPQLTLGGY